MRARLTTLAAAAALLSGCAYVGDPLPPALNIPQPVTDFSMVQRGADLILTYTAPALTTEDLGIREFGSVDVRVGPVPPQFSIEEWASGAKRVDSDVPEPGKPVTLTIPASEWQGREVLAAVRFGNAKGRLSGWSKTETVKVGPPLPQPQVEARSAPEGVRLTWTPAPGAEYRITRRAEGETVDTAAGSVTAGEFLDRTAVRGKPYTYVVQAFAGKNESKPSSAVTLVPRDEFAPAPPSGLSAVAGQNSIELIWERNTEPDVSSYRVYRAIGDGPFTVLADALPGTAFSDRQITSGTAYRYQVTATDQSGNESPRSQAIQSTAP
jgi:hypothetical protein